MAVRGAKTPEMALSDKNPIGAHLYSLFTSAFSYQKM